MRCGRSEFKLAIRSQAYSPWPCTTTTTTTTDDDDDKVRQHDGHSAKSRLHHPAHKAKAHRRTLGRARYAHLATHAPHTHQTRSHRWQAVVESRFRRKKSRPGVDVFQFARTVEDETWEDGALRETLQVRLGAGRVFVGAHAHVSVPAV